MELEGRKTLVLGAGRSGVAASEFLAGKGAVVALHDRKPEEEWSEKARSLRSRRGVGLIAGKLPSWLLDQIDLVVISPGVPRSVLPARYVERKDGEVIGEVELAYRFLEGRIIGITGSNGKTTTTSLVGRLLRDAGLETRIGGNIGIPLLSLVGKGTGEAWTVVELSSFQLESIVRLRPNIGVCLNVTPNHMDRYDLFTDYAAAKHRLFMNQTRDDLAVLNADDEMTSSWKGGLKAETVCFSTAGELDEGLFLRGGDLVCRASGKEKQLAKRSDLRLIGVHNVQNVLASLAVGLACGADPDSMRETLTRFEAVEHRLEFVTRIRGVRFINDSKATSVDAAKRALEALAESAGGRVVLILGGLGKNAPYEPMREAITRSVRSLVLIGEDAENIAEQLAGSAEILRSDSLGGAVAVAFEAAEEGDSVLLAPACASFDMFENFEQRGSRFKSEVLALKDRVESEEGVPAVNGGRR